MPQGGAKFFMGDLYPGGGRVDTFLASIPGGYDVQELSESDKPAPAIVSDLKQANIGMALIILVGAIVLFHL